MFRPQYPLLIVDRLVKSHQDSPISFTHWTQEWLISTPKHVALYNAFNWNPPTFAHAGLLCSPNGEKLSKRNRDIDIDIAAYRDKGILPSALNNWLALLGWSPDKNAGTKGDVFPTMDDLAKKVRLSRFSSFPVLPRAECSLTAALVLPEIHQGQRADQPRKASYLSTCPPHPSPSRSICLR